MANKYIFTKDFGTVLGNATDRVGNLAVIYTPANQTSADNYISAIRLLVTGWSYQMMTSISQPVIADPNLASGYVHLDSFDDIRTTTQYNKLTMSFTFVEANRASLITILNNFNTMSAGCVYNLSQPVSIDLVQNALQDSTSYDPTIFGVHSEVNWRGHGT